MKEKKVRLNDGSGSASDILAVINCAIDFRQFLGRPGTVLAIRKSDLVHFIAVHETTNR